MPAYVRDRPDAVRGEQCEELLEAAIRMTYGQEMHPGSILRSDGWRAYLRALLAGVVVVFAAVVYAPRLDAPFVGDDYVFLDKTRAASFGSLWSLRNTDFGWYRPWSRELHFWTFQHLFGPREPGFRVASLALWLGMLAAYFALLARIRGERVATIAMLGVASLALWGAPLTWISGVQDLWMLLFAALTLWLVASGRTGWALLSCAGALLSKETAAMLPLILLAQARWIERLSVRGCAGRVAPFVALTVAWMLVHPTLLHRVSRPAPDIPNGERPSPPALVIAQTVLTTFNADRITLPIEPDLLRPVTTALLALMVAGAAWLALREPRARGKARAAGPSSTAPSRRDVMTFGAAWCVAGWLPLLSRSIGWHAYYGSLGVLGAWVVLGELLERWPNIAVASLLVLGLLRGHAEATRSWDWGSQWYQTRAGSLLRTIKEQLLELHPTMPRHSRLYFVHIPNNIGLIAGRSPAVRVWYGDPTLEAGFYSYYRARAPRETLGTDLFFHFDSTTGIREILLDGSDRGAPGGPDAVWERDHIDLATTMVANGDLPRAARLFEVVADLRPERTDAWMFAATCWEATGDSVSAARDLERARAATGLKPEEIRLWADRLRATMPHHAPTVP